MGDDAREHELPRPRPRRKHKKTRLPDILRRIVWPVGERTEIALWARALRLYPCVACVLALAAAVSSCVMPLDDWLALFLQPGSEQEAAARYHLCGTGHTPWHACAAARRVPAFVVFCLLYTASVTKLLCA